jgi:hypothetical protein
VSDNAFINGAKMLALSDGTIPQKYLQNQAQSLSLPGSAIPSNIIIVSS